MDLTGYDTDADHVAADAGAEDRDVAPRPRKLKELVSPRPNDGSYSIRVPRIDFNHERDDDKAYVLNFVAQIDATALQYASPRLRSDVDVAAAAPASGTGDAFPFLGPPHARGAFASMGAQLRDAEAVVLAAVRRDGDALGEIPASMSRHNRSSPTLPSRERMTSKI